MVKGSLKYFKKEWKKVAVSSRGVWKTSQRKDATQKPRLTNYDADIVSPGSKAKVALENKHGKITVHAIPEGRQSELCSILVNVCTSHSSEVNQALIRKTKSGIKYLKFEVKQDGVRKILKNKEMSFYFKVLTKDGGVIFKYFSVDLSIIRQRGWSRWRIWRVKREYLFPEYNQHKCCGCYTGCGPVAWASVLGFYDRLAHHAPSSGYSKRFWSCRDGRANNCMAPARMNANVRRYVEGIRKTLRTFCLFGGGATTPKGMKRIINWYRARGIGGRVYSHRHSLSWSGWTKKWIRDRAARHIIAGYPAIVGVWVKGSKKKAMHYPIATRYAQRSRRYRSCFLFWCRTKTKYAKSFYLHMGWGGSSNGWYNIKAFAAFAARKY